MSLRQQGDSLDMDNCMHVAPSDVGCMGMGGAAMIVTGERGGGGHREGRN